jgi:hypothetical protein
VLVDRLSEHSPMDSLSAAVLLSELEELVDRPLDLSVLEGIGELAPTHGAELLGDRLRALASDAARAQQPFSSTGPLSGYGHDPSGVALR